MTLNVNGKRISIEAEQALLAVLHREVRTMRRWAASVGGSKEMEEEAERLREVIEAVVGEPAQNKGELT